MKWWNPKSSDYSFHFGNHFGLEQAESVWCISAWLFRTENLLSLERRIIFVIQIAYFSDAYCAVYLQTKVYTKLVPLLLLCCLKDKFWCHLQLGWTKFLPFLFDKKKWFQLAKIYCCQKDIQKISPWPKQVLNYVKK